MSHRLVAISGCCPEYRPKVSRLLKEHETFPEEGSAFYLEDLLQDVHVYEIRGTCACFYLQRPLVERLRDQNDWDEDEPLRSAA